jgi:hypothetical protein
MHNLQLVSFLVVTVSTVPITSVKYFFANAIKLFEFPAIVRQFLGYNQSCASKTSTLVWMHPVRPYFHSIDTQAHKNSVILT